MVPCVFGLIQNFCYAAQSYMKSICIVVLLTKMVDGFQKFFHLHSKRNLKNAKKISYHPMIAF